MYIFINTYFCGYIERRREGKRGSERTRERSECDISRPEVQPSVSASQAVCSSCSHIVESLEPSGSKYPNVRHDSITGI